MDILYALHDFEAENPDELSFAAGEAIVVLERDDQYGDGWFQGRNTSGEIGLFPQSYTSPTPPVDSPSPSPTAVEPPTGSLTTQSEHPVISATLMDVQNALDQLAVSPRPASPSSRVSTSSLNGDGRASDDEDSPVENPRAVLAAKAAANAEREARDAQDREERRRREDEEAYARARGAGIPEGLQLSDESDEEPEPELNSMATRAPPQETPPPQAKAAASFIDVTDTPTSSPPRPIPIPNPATSSIPPTAKILTFEDAPVVKEPEPTALAPTTPGSDYNLDLPTNEPVPSLPLPVAAVPFEATEAQEVLSHSTPAPEAQQPEVVASPTSPSASYLRPFELSAIVAASGAAATTVALASRRTPEASAQVEALPTPIKEETTPEEVAASTLASVADPVSTSTPPKVLLPPSQFTPNSPLAPADVTRFPREGTPPLFSARADRAISPDVIAPSPLQSSQSSMADTVPLTAKSVGTAQTSPRASPDAGIQGLPYDPTTWGVDEVIEWGKAKGFDALTLSKFKEHEISGDILVEMDIAMLKEIDLVAFGKRVHIYNGIKELKARIARSAINISPQASRYDPDSPGMASFTPYAASSFAGSIRESRRESDVTRSDDGSPGLRSPPMAGFFAPPVNPSNASIIEEEGEYTEMLDGATPKGPPRLVFPSRRAPGASASSSRNFDFESDAGSTLSRTNSTAQGFKSLFSVSRARKPPPKVVPSPSRSSLATSSKRGTRLFSFGPNSAGLVESPRKPLVVSTARSPGDAKSSSMSPKIVDAASPEMRQVQPDAVTTGDLLQKIGRPDYSGWMGKKGEKYNTWKQRFFVLKGVHLYYLKSETEQKVKGFIDLAGYRILAGSNMGADGQFGFKIVHVTERTHYFSAAEQVTVRTWMKEIMKATIGRDYSAPVVSSHNIETIPLVVAQAMSPRPPSPTSRARVQKERYAGNNPNTLTPSDAQKLMEFSSGTPLLGGASPRASGSPTFPTLERRASSVYSQARPSASPKGRSISRSSSDKTVAATASAILAPPKDPDAGPVEELNVETAQLLEWVNSHLPSTTPPAKDLGQALSSGQVLVQLVEHLAGTQSGLTADDFSTYNPASPNTYFENAFKVFDFMSLNVSTDDISMGDMLSGNEPQLIVLVERIKAKYSS